MPTASAERAPRLLLTALSAFVLASCLSLSVGALGGVAHVQDEISYDLQATIFAHGERMAPPPTDGSYQVSVFEVNDEGWYSIFPIGWPLVLALGVKLGATWLVNPLLASTLPWLTWAAFKRWLDPTELWFAAVVSAISPGILALGGSMMSHTLVLVCGLVTLIAVGARNPPPWLITFGGLAGGLMVLARPYDAVLVFAPMAAWLVYRIYRGEIPFDRLVPFALGPVLATIVTLADNAHLTGSPFGFAVDRYFDRTFYPGCNRIGFGDNHGCTTALRPHGYQLDDAMDGLTVNATIFDDLLFGLPFGALVALRGARALASRAPALVAPIIFVPLGYALYWNNGACFGARLWHPVYLAALPAAGISLAWISRHIHRYVPWTVLIAGFVHTVPQINYELSNRYWCVDDRLKREVEAEGVDKGIVILVGEGVRWQDVPLTHGPVPLTCIPWIDSGSVLTMQDPWAVPPAISWLFIPSDNEDRFAEVVKNHPDEDVWLVHEDLKTSLYTITRWSGSGQVDEPEALAADPFSGTRAAPPP